MSRDADWAALYGDNPGNGSDRRSRPPIWVVIVVVVSVVVGGWLLVTQESVDGDPVASPATTTNPFEPSVVTTATASAITTTTASPTAGDPDPVFVNPQAGITPETRQPLRGYVAVTAPDAPPFDQSSVWVFRPGGSLVSRTDAIIDRYNAGYPMLITAGHLLMDSANGWIFDIDLAEPPTSVWTNGTVIPGSEPGIVWLAQQQSVPDERSYVSPVDVESLTVGERIDITNLFDRPIVGAADGLIVVDHEEEFAFWSPTDGLVPLLLPGADALDADHIGAVVAASGNLVVVPSNHHVRVFDIVGGEYVGQSVRLPAAREQAVTSACLSPDQQHVIIAGRFGQAGVGNITTGEVIDLKEAPEQYFGSGLAVQQEHGIGWTTDDQLVFIGEYFDSKHIFGFNVATGESFHVATLDRREGWWLTASGTMC